MLNVIASPDNVQAMLTRSTVSDKNQIDLRHCARVRRPIADICSRHEATGRQHDQASQELFLSGTLSPNPETLDPPKP